MIFKKLVNVSVASIGLMVSVDVSFAANTPHLASVQTVGTSKIPFTSTRVPAASYVDFPFNAVGKLWFKKADGTSSVCTGSLIRPGVVVTAGHCVHSGNGSATGYSYDFRFAPGYHNGIMPFGIWTETVYKNVPTDWYQGGGKRPSTADYALIVFAKDNVGKRIGDVANWLGWKWDKNTNIFIKHPITSLGYSNTLDKGKMLYKVDSILHKGVSNTGVFGSNLMGGSDGSPIILEYGKNKSNYIISVTSYSGKAALKKQVASLFDKRFGNLFESTCNLYFWACDTGE